MWIRLDDAICHHPKFVQVGAEAAWLFVGGLGYCGRYLTDGFIPKAALGALTTIPKPERAASALVAIGLWELVTPETAPGGGWLVHDYAAYQLSRDEVEKRREQRRNAGRSGGRRSGEARSKRPASYGDEAHAKRAASPVDEANANPDPTPDPDPGVVTTKEPSSQHPPRAGGPTLMGRHDPRFVNRGPVGLWTWQFERFRQALVPRFGDEVTDQLRTWVATIDARAFEGAWDTTPKESVWWQARFEESFGTPTVSTAKTAGNAEAIRRFVARGVAVP